MRKFAVLLALTILSANFALAQSYYAKDKVLRVTYSYGSEEAIPGTQKTYFIDWYQSPPIVCDEKPRPHDCPHLQIPVGRTPPELTEHDNLGLSWAYLLEDDVVFEAGAFMPLGAAGADNLGVSVGMNYLFGRWFVPATLAYRGDLDTIALSLGGGYDFLSKKGISLRVKVAPEWYADGDLEERWGWKSEVAAGWVF